MSIFLRAAASLLASGGRLRLASESYPAYGSDYDPDALAYWQATQLSTDVTYYVGTAYEITGLNMLRAVDAFVRALKRGGTWSKLQARYPLVGGTDFAHQWNLQNPSGQVTGYNLSFVGSPAHGPTGVAWNGINQYANTNAGAEIMLDSFSNTLLYYAASNAQDPNRGGQAVMGDAVNGSAEILLAVNRGDLLLYASPDDYSYPLASGQPPAKGVFIGTRTSATYAAVYRDGQKKGESTATATGNFGTPDIKLGQAIAGVYSIVPCQGAAFGAGLTAAEVASESAAWLQLNTALKRA